MEQISASKYKKHSFRMGELVRYQGRDWMVDMCLNGRYDRYVLHDLHPDTNPNPIINVEFENDRHFVRIDSDGNII